MISISSPPTIRSWKTVSFASTLHLYPILDLLLKKIPTQLHPEIRLGLQEALVNAAKHGNRLDPCKTVKVKFCYKKSEYSWIVCDQGDGFEQESNYSFDDENLPAVEAENGRGFCLLHQIFDRVTWNPQGTKVELYKQVDHNLPNYSRFKFY